MRTFFLLAFALTLVVGATAQPVELRYHLPEGMSYAVKSKESSQMQMQMQDNFGNRQSMTQSFESPTNYRVEVLEAEGSGDAGPGKVRYTFDPGLTMTMSNSMSGQQQQPLPFAGQAFEVTRRNGQIAVSTAQGPAENLPPETRGMLENLATFNESTLLPDRPVSVGDSWQPEMASVKRTSGMAPGDTLVMTARLAGMEQVAGRPAAILDLELARDGSMQGMVMKGSQKGRAAVDLGTGLLLEFDLSGQLQVANDPNAGMGGSMTGTSSPTSTRRVSGLVVPAAGPASPERAFETVVEERDPDGGGGAFGGGGRVMNLAAPPFEGTFVGDELSVTLIEGDRRAVEIVRGELTTRGVLTGQREIDQSPGPDGGTVTTIRFRGEFTFNGDDYPFSAEQPDETTMRFKTGKTTHTLQRETEEKAPNPFE